jgi:hypothetical protein
VLPRRQLRLAAGSFLPSRRPPYPRRLVRGRADGHAGVTVAARLHRDGATTEVPPTRALAAIDGAHLHRPVAAHPDVVDAAAMASAALPAVLGRVGLLAGQEEPVAALAATGVGRCWPPRRGRARR